MRIDTDDLYDLDTSKDVMMVAEDTVPYGTSKLKHDFPYGIYFGSHIKDTVKNRIGCVVGVKEDYILVAFEDDMDPQIIPADAESFEKGYYSLA